MHHALSITILNPFKKEAYKTTNYLLEIDSHLSDLFKVRADNIWLYEEYQENVKVSELWFRKE